MYSQFFIKITHSLDLKLKNNCVRGPFIVAKTKSLIGRSFERIFSCKINEVIEF